jgi:glycerol-3-phosphate acyltransferase PlsX
MRIALDAMGSDRAPAVEVEGAVGALLAHPGLRVVLVGDEAAILAELERFPEAPRERVEVVHASEVIRMDESPAQAVRRKPDSSIVRGLRLQKEGRADAFVSAGSTGAVMAASLLTLRPLPGVDRPPVAAALPAPNGRFLLLDMGANIDLKPAHFVQFAHLGTIYAQDLMGIERPRVGLLNIGEEEEKGNEQTVEAHRLLREAEGLDFVGNVEGREIIAGKCDVLVCDGFVGNVLLKFYESVAGFMAELLMQEMEQQQCFLDLTPMYRRLDYTEWGGAPLLGIRGVTFICHGGSPPRAIQNAILAAAHAVERGLVDHMARRLAAVGGSGTDA